MKYRMGFVSNSSSSSFMGGIGIITDYEKFEKWKASFDEYIKSDITIYDGEGGWRDVRENNDNITIPMPVNSEPEVSVSKKEAEEQLNNIPIEKRAKYKLLNNDYHNVVYFVIGNNEGDDAFMNYERDGLDYSIVDIDYFDEDQQRLYKEFGSDESGVVCSDKIFGVDRNG